MNVLKRISLVSVFTLLLYAGRAQDLCRFPVDFDNFNTPSSWTGMGNNAWSRKLAFGITASEAWALEFRVSLDGFQGIQNMLIGLTNDSSLSFFGNEALAHTIPFLGLRIRRQDEQNDKWIVTLKPCSMSTNQNDFEKQFSILIPAHCFLRLECLNPYEARITSFSDEELKDSIKGASNSYEFNCRFEELNSFFIQSDQEITSFADIKSQISELRFFNRIGLSYPERKKSGYNTWNQAALEIIPNPNTGSFQILVQNEPDNALISSIEIYNSTGILEYTTEFIGNHSLVELKNIRPGIYLLKLFVAEKIFLRKFIVY